METTDARRVAPRSRGRARRELPLTLNRSLVHAIAALALGLLALTFAGGYAVGRRQRSVRSEAVATASGYTIQVVVAPRAEKRADEIATSTVEAQAAALPPSPRRVEVKTSLPPGMFGLQLGAFPSKAEADEFIAAHAAALDGHQVFLTPAEVPGRGVWYRVRVGAERTREAAERLLPSLAEALRTTAIVTPYK